ncbi:Tumor suppressor p53-binding protein [Echinococcus granulosus]|uniref:Tumor suppressor p53-binding protein n=1 Tax=Echinococcus granulosus TaxID=6210 RepID=W6UVB2_ECHGR|nr:Tumor suppressor p53-binding protein [Echinococcus granulosus]EUB62342.1 Tumor suppressor p53-binding protein [Echinococcus granulosus]
MEGVYSESDNSENIIPSSDLEPPPPVNYILSKSRNGCVLAEESSNQEFGVSEKFTWNASSSILRAVTQQDDFEDIRCSSLNEAAGETSLDSLSRDISLHTLQVPSGADSPTNCQKSVSSPIRSTLSSEVLENIKKVNPKRMDQMDKILSTTLGVRASLPIAPPKHAQRSSATRFRSLANMEPNFCSTDSLISTPIGATTTNTTSDRTTRSGSDLFRSDSSGFSKPLVLPGNCRNTVSTSTATDDQEASPAFSYTLSLSVLRHSSKVEKTDLVEFKIPDFTKTVTWQSRIRRVDEDAAAAVSEAAKVLADSLGDWLRELFTSDSEGPQCDYNRTPATVIAQHQSIFDVRVSSSSSEYFLPLKMNALTKRPETNGQGPPKNVTDGTIDREQRGVLVYAKWYSNKFFYAGQIAETSAEDKFRILFDDSSQKNVTGKNIILAELLPIGANASLLDEQTTSVSIQTQMFFSIYSTLHVYADISGKSEYEVGYLVSGHVIGTTPPSYIVKRIEDNEVFQLERKRVAIVLESMIHLLAAGQISTVGSRSDISSVTSGTSSFISPTSSSSSPSKYVPRVVLSKVVTPNTPVGSSVRRKRVLTEVGRIAERAVPAKRLMRRKTAPQQKRRSPSVSTPSLASRSLESAKQRRTRSGAKVSAQRQEFKRKHSGFSRRESQIWVVGRRAVARASRASMRFSSTSRSSSRSRRAPRTRPSGKRRKFSSPLDNTITPSLPTLTVETSIEQQETPPPVVPVLPPLLSESAISLKDQSMRTAESEELRRMCQRHRIPLPHPDLFSQWCVVRTKGVNSTDLKGIRIASSSPHARKQFSVCENASFLRLLITAGGGQNMELLDADCVSPTGRLVTPEEEAVVSKAKRPHIVLIASSAKRTVKFLQGLATLGRVPLVHPVWLLDACFLAGGREPLVADSEVVSKIVTLATEPADIPFELLRRSARTLYELPRGVDRITNQTVLPHNVPAWFIEPLDVFGPKTLLALGGYTSSRIIAIVTDDFPGFGKGWFSILRHAMYTESGVPATDGMPKIITSAESVDQLNRLKTMEDAPTCKSNIVLVDQERIPEDTVPQIESMGFTVINKEFLIQSLIHGKMLDLKYGTTWKE